MREKNSHHKANSLWSMARPRRVELLTSRSVEQRKILWRNKIEELQEI